jgi:predicted nuclease of predicted toxin-antitoxin system
MKPRFLVDAQLPPALADRLSSIGYYAEHVARVGLGGAGDNAIWAYAKQSGMILITKDEDFVLDGIARRDGTPGDLDSTRQHHQ